VTTLVPTSKGIVADHCVVPEATPDAPVEVVHFTAVTPTLSVAVPLKTIVPEYAEAMLDPGERIANDGGVVSGVAGCEGVGG
jgi:hypothetical protein